jgi:hypothetical protein
MSYKEQIKRVEEQYRAAGGKWPASAAEVAEWGVSTGRLQIGRGAIVRRFAEEIAEAWSHQYMDDPQGRRIRVKHAARYSIDGVQTWLWDNMPTATHKHMELSFQNKRQLILMDCHQLKIDVDSYNENFNKGKKIQMVFDFRNDLDELDLAAKDRRRHAA